MKNNSITFRLSDEKYKKIKNLANRSGASISSIVCLAVSEYFEKYYDTDAKVNALLKEPKVLSGCLRCKQEGVGCENSSEKCKNSEVIKYDPFSLGLEEEYPKTCIVEWFGEKYI